MPRHAPIILQGAGIQRAGIVVPELLYFHHCALWTFLVPLNWNLLQTHSISSEGWFTYGHIPWHNTFYTCFVDYDHGANHATLLCVIVRVGKSGAMGVIRNNYNLWMSLYSEMVEKSVRNPEMGNGNWVIGRKKI